MCQPCSIKYAFIGLVDSYGEDMRRILDYVNATKYVTLPERNQTGYMTEKSSEVLQLYLKDIPTSLIKRFYENYYWDYFLFGFTKSNRKAMNRNWSNQKANPALKTKTGNK